MTSSPPDTNPSKCPNGHELRYLGRSTAICREEPGEVWGVWMGRVSRITAHDGAMHALIDVVRRLR